MASAHTRTAVRAWIPALVWITIIFLESSAIFSARNTGSLLAAILYPFFGSIEPLHLQVINGVLRKFGHFAGYGFLALLLLRAWRATLLPGARSLAVLWHAPSGVAALFVTIAVASLDEWHQSHLPVRTGSLHDVLLDTAGAIFVLALVFTFRPAAASQQADPSLPSA